MCTNICIHIYESNNNEIGDEFKREKSRKEGYMVGFWGEKRNDVIVLLHQN